MLSLGLGGLRGNKARRSTEGGKHIIFRNQGIDGENGTSTRTAAHGLIEWQDAACFSDDPSLENSPECRNISESERTATSISSSSCSESFETASTSSSSGGGNSTGPKGICRYFPGIAWVNLERSHSPGCRPLHRSLELDEVARSHAQAMADALKVHHSDPASICTKLRKKSSTGSPIYIMGENVAHGTTVKDIHATMIQNQHDLANMINPQYSEMGMATARSINLRGNESIYLCQLFRG